MGWSICWLVAGCCCSCDSGGVVVIGVIQVPAEGVAVVGVSQVPSASSSLLSLSLLWREVAFIVAGGASEEEEEADFHSLGTRCLEDALG